MKLTHVDDQGRARMVDVGDKPVTTRTAVAEGRITMSAEACRIIADGAAAKGDVLAAGELAGTLGAKQTATLIPLCHPIGLDRVSVSATVDPTLPGVRVRTEVRATARTGVEMEALTGVAVALLTIYDMVKSADRAMEVGPIHLVSKSGGASGGFQRDG